MYKTKRGYETVMKIGYAVLVSDEVFNFMRELEVEFLEKFGANRGLAQPPHIAIKGPFDTDDLRWHAKYLDSLARQVKPLTVHLKGVRAFGPHAIFLDVVPHPALHQLTAKMLSDLPVETHTPFEANQDIHHHATVAFPDSEEVFEQAMAQYADLRVDLEFTVDRLALFYQHQDTWIVYKKVQVSG